MHLHGRMERIAGNESVSEMKAAGGGGGGGGEEVAALKATLEAKQQELANALNSQGSTGESANANKD